MAEIDAVVFDLDGVLIDSEEAWNEARREFTLERGGRWTERAQGDMMGMSSTEWSRYLHDELGVGLAPAQISDAVVERLERRYREHLPLIDGAVEAVERLAERWPLALASSANRPVIDLVLERADLARFFRATVSSEEVARGKPAPDVYVAAARALGVDAACAAAIEDSSNGLRAARAAAMRVVAIPNSAFPPSEGALGEADVVLGGLAELTVDVIEGLA
jgi:HAD superfamily hydrolase (TIGR01509 family)